MFFDGQPAISHSLKRRVNNPRIELPAHALFVSRVFPPRDTERFSNGIGRRPDYREDYLAWTRKVIASSRTRRFNRIEQWTSGSAIADESLLRQLEQECFCCGYASFAPVFADGDHLSQNGVMRNVAVAVLRPPLRIA